MDIIKKETPSANLRTLVFDLEDLASVRKAAEKVNAYIEKIDVCPGLSSSLPTVYGYS